MQRLTSTIIRFAAVVGAIPLAIGLVQNGILNEAQAAGLLIAVVVAVAFVSSFMAIALPLFGIALFITYSAHSNAEFARAAFLLSLLGFVLLGSMYFLLGGGLPLPLTRSGRFYDQRKSRGTKSVLVGSIALLGAVPGIMTLVQKGVITVWGAILLTVIIALGIGITRVPMKIIMPLYGASLLITHNYTTDPELKAASLGVIMLAITLFGLFIIVRRGVMTISGKTG